jgi:hypothetical protein
MANEGGFTGSCFANLCEDLGVNRISSKFIPCHFRVDLKSLARIFPQILCNNLKRTRNSWNELIPVIRRCRNKAAVFRTEVKIAPKTENCDRAIRMWTPCPLFLQLSRFVMQWIHFKQSRILPHRLIILRRVRKKRVEIWRGNNWSSQRRRWSTHIAVCPGVARE